MNLGQHLLRMGLLACAVSCGPLGAQTDWVKVTPQYDREEISDAWRGANVAGVMPRIVSLSSSSRNYAYCWEWSDECGCNAERCGCLTVIDITNPVNPRRVARYDNATGWPYGLPISTNFSYAPDAIETWWVTDNSDPANPKPVGGYKAIAAVWGVQVSGQYAYASEGDGRLAVINVSDPASPQRVGQYLGTNDIAAVVVAGKYAYAVARGEPEELEDGSSVMIGGGLQVIDISDAANPKRIGWYEYESPTFAGWSGGVAVRGSYAYVTESHPRVDDWQGMYLQVIDVSDPANMRRTGSCDFVPGCPGISYVTTSGNYAYVAYGPGSGCTCCANAGLAVIDVSDPANPRRVGGWEMDAFGGVGCPVVASGDRVYAGLGWIVCPFVITELPAITRAERSANGLAVEWNDAAKGMKLQRAGSLTQSNWQGVPGSEATNSVTLPLESSTGFFRLVKP